MMIGNWLNPPSGIARDVVCAAGAILGAWLLLLRWSWRGPSRNVLAVSFASLRDHRFVYLLKAEAFADPLGVVMTLSGGNSSWYLHRLWTRAEEDVAGMAAEAGRPDLSGAPRIRPTSAAGWRSHRLTAQPLAARGWALAVVTLPAELGGNTHFVGIAVPAVMLARREAEAARRAVRVFVLNGWGLGRETDFVEHTAAGRTLTYNFGTGNAVEAFAAAVREKLRTPLPAWARRAPVVA